MSEPNNVSIAPESPYASMEFDTFLKEIGGANIKSWTILAELIGVDRKTIYRWRQHPLAKLAITTRAMELLDSMESIGSGDWKMYRELLKVLGVKDKSTLELEAGEGVQEIVDSLKTDYEKAAQKLEEVNQ